MTSHAALVLEVGQDVDVLLAARLWVLLNLISCTPKVVRLEAGSPPLSPRDRILRVERASWLAPLISIRWSAESTNAVGSINRDSLLGLERSLLDSSGDMQALWQAARRPPAAPIAGRPDYRKEWLVVEGQIDSYARERAEQLGCQLHSFGRPPDGFDTDVVFWRKSPTSMGPVLHRSALVLARPGALAWDAVRLGCVTETLASAAPEDTAWRLARIARRDLVSAELLRSLISGTDEPRGTRHWSTLPTWTRGSFRRKFRKLLRSPVRFFRDAFG